MLAHDARAFVANDAARYGAFSPSGSTGVWRVDAFTGAGRPTVLGTQERFADHAALAADGDGALLALTLLDDAVGAVYRFEPGGRVTALFEGQRFKAQFTSVVGAGDYVFAGSPLVRFHKPSRKASALGVRDVVQLAASEGTLFVAQQRLTQSSRSPDTLETRWTIRSTPHAKAALSVVAEGEGLVYGLSASPAGVAWSTLDTPNVGDAAMATGSIWLRRDKSTAPSRLARGLPVPMGVALDGGHVYVALRGGRGDGVTNGGVVRIPLGGGAPEVVAADIGSPVVVAVDDRRIYTLAESRAQVSAPYFSAGTYISEAGDLLAFEKLRPGP